LHRPWRLLFGLIATCVGVTLFVVPGVAQDDRPNLMISAAAEPPDFEVSGGQFRMSFTVSNEGRARARESSVVRAYLSRGRRFDRGDIRLGNGVRVPSVAAGAQVTGRLVARIPRNVPNGTYFLITCADATDVISESTNLNNCLLSGQKTSLNVPGGPGAPGPPGPTGPKGATGDAGPQPDIRRIPRTVVEPGTRTVDDPPGNPDNFTEDDDNTVANEGSTTAREVLKVGPISFRALCLADEEDVGGGGGQVRPREAKLVVYTDRGTMSLAGAHGKRSGIPAGEGTAGRAGVEGGEGKRLLLAADEAGQIFKGGEGWVSTTEGTEIAINELYLGMGVLGAGPDSCVFGGTVRVVSGG
jgi:hypothetical protein